MKSTISAKRKNDAVITIRQNNRNKKIEIMSMNLAAEKMIGHSSTDMYGKDFSIILPERIKDLIESYVDFEGGMGSDFLAVARRVPNFQLINKFGDEIPVSLKVFNLVANNAEVQEYELLMRDITLISKIEELKEHISANRDEAIDPHTGLPSEVAVQDALSTVKLYVDQFNLEASFAIISVDFIEPYLENYGEDESDKIVKNIGVISQECCRDEDLVGHLGEGYIGAVLLDCNASDAASVISRIQKKIDSAGIIIGSDQVTSNEISIVYSQLSQGVELATIIDNCRAGLSQVVSSETKRVLQV